MPRSRVDDTNIIINDSKRYSRTAKKAIQCGEEENKEEEEEPAHCQEDRRPGPAHFLGMPHTEDTGREQPEEVRKQMNDISYQ